MKKIIYSLLVTAFFIGTVEAFEINMDKIDLGSRSNKVVSTLNKTYKIETKGFENKIINDSEIADFSKKLTSISLSNKSKDEITNNLKKDMYISKDNGADTLNSKMFIEMFVKSLLEKKVKANYIKDIKTVEFNGKDKMSFVYLEDATVNDKKKEVILAFWFKANDEGYKLYYPWLTIDDNLEAYFKKVTDNENNGNIIGSSYKKLSLDGEDINLSDELLTRIFNTNKNRVVQLTGMKDSGSNAYGSGFYLREGVVVTTWSLFLKFMNDSNFIYISDYEGNTYEILGVIAAQIDYDVVVLKINKNVGTGVRFGDTSKLKTNDNLFMINSKNKGGFSINYGTFISLNNGKMKNMFLLNESDVGAALFNEDGHMVGFNVKDQLNSELSYANSTDYLKTLQRILNNQVYTNITYTPIETFKQNYYNSLEDEKRYNVVDKKVWDEYKKIGNLEENIKLSLIKASYKDNILSLRYKNNSSSMIDSIYLVSEYTTSLVNTGFKLTYEDQYKTIYKNDKYKVIIKSNLNYIIILIMEN